MYDTKYVYGQISKRFKIKTHFETFKRRGRTSSMLPEPCVRQCPHGNILQLARYTFFEGLNILIITVCVFVDGFQGISKIFTTL
jgi:hypothetical protein